MNWNKLQITEGVNWLQQEQLRSVYTGYYMSVKWLRIGQKDNTSFGSNATFIMTILSHRFILLYAC